MMVDPAAAEVSDAGLLPRSYGQLITADALDGSRWRFRGAAVARHGGGRAKGV